MRLKKDCDSVFLFLVYFLIVLAHFGSCLSSETENFAYDEAIHLDSRRYRISTKKLNYTQATDACTRDGSSLAIINSSEITTALYQGLERSSLGGAGLQDQNLVNEGVWIGLKIDRSSETGVWSDGASYHLNTSYNNWAPGEPQSQNCVQLWKAHRWQWDDTYCDLPRNFICEDQSPQSFTEFNVNMLTQDILRLSNEETTTSSALNHLSLDANRLLDVPNLSSFLSESQANDVLLAIETVTRKYNASQENSSISRSNIEIDVLGQITGYEDVIFGRETRNSDSSWLSSIVLTKSLLNEAKRKAGKREIEVSSILYRESKLFLSTPDPETVFGEGASSIMNRSILGNVISVDVRNTLMNNLDSPVIINHVVDLTKNPDLKATLNISCSQENSCHYEKFLSSDIRQQSTFQCVHWNFTSRSSSGDWSQSGCHLHSISINNDIANISCRCNHMTNFAIILNTSEYYEPAYLTALTTASCIIAIMCLVITLSTHLFFKQLRTKPMQQILIHICIGLIALNLFFLLGIDRTDQATFCYATAVILHYSVLLSWNWMLLEGIFLFRTFVLCKAGSETGVKLSPLIITICYAFPAISVATCAAALQERYLSQRYCWIGGELLVYTIVVPVGIVLLINFGIFFIVMWNITRKTKKFRKQWDFKNACENLRRAFYMTVVLGLPWAFGYFMLLSKDASIKNVFSILFTIANAVQGLGIVFLFCLRHENVRGLWATSTRRGYRRTATLLGGSTTKTFKRSQNHFTKSTNTYAQTVHTKKSTSSTTTSQYSSENQMPRYVRTPQLKQNY